MYFACAKVLEVFQISVIQARSGKRRGALVRRAAELRLVADANVVPDLAAFAKGLADDCGD
jgi:hypothetical protein